MKGQPHLGLGGTIGTVSGWWGQSKETPWLH